MMADDREIAIWPDGTAVIRLDTMEPSERKHLYHYRGLTPAQRAEVTEFAAYLRGKKGLPFRRPTSEEERHG